MLNFFRGLLNQAVKATIEDVEFEFALGELPFHFAMALLGASFESRYNRRLNYQESVDICDSFARAIESREVDPTQICFLCGELGATEVSPIHDQCLRNLEDRVQVWAHPTFVLGFFMGLPTGLMPKFVLTSFLDFQIKVQVMVMARAQDKSEVAEFISLLRGLQDQFASDLYQAMGNSQNCFLNGMFKGARLHRFIKEPKAKSSLVVETETCQVSEARQQA